MSHHSLLNINKATLLNRFSLSPMPSYHQETLNRLQSCDQKLFRPAAVMIGFIEREDGLHVLLTKRASHLKHHPGQVSFPGGKFELQDRDLANTALRETFEELGIPREKIEIFGKMSTLPTISRFNVSPFLAFIHSDYQLKIDPNEVESAFEMPASILFDRDQLFSAKFDINRQPHRIFALVFNDHFIWGVTAQIIDALQRQLQFHPSNHQIHLKL